MFKLGWFADPVVFGKYPDEMHNLITGDRLPSFTSEQSKLLKGSYDFLGVNYYTSNYAKYTGVIGSNFYNDGRYTTGAYNATGHLIGPFGQSSWLNVYPQGFRDLLNHVNDRYNHPIIYILENGVSCPNENTAEDAINDSFRMDYLYGHVMKLAEAVRFDKVNIRGYFHWSLLDNFEWADGFSSRYGLTYVNFDQNLTRTIKKSGYLYRNIIDAFDEMKIEDVLELSVDDLMTQDDYDENDDYDDYDDYDDFDEDSAFADEDEDE
ncbi:unnamed protein product [Blepharisma stoltei]|uniref:Beta-glucosidase n=1 Tax=Blepharisma stoltei TaxID=1481888 RepID=A0AAU9JF35_9CILI|nr:unnamed protein product [Blepharisma stoltei]